MTFCILETNFFLHISESLDLECFSDYVKNARYIAKNRNIFTKQQKIDFIRTSIFQMECQIGFIENKKELQSKKWLYNQDKNEAKLNQYLILQCDETAEYYLFCAYCVCFTSSGAKSQVANGGLRIKGAKDVRKLINNHLDTLSHQKSEKEYFDYRGVVTFEHLEPSRLEKIEKNRFIVNEVLETLMHLISNSK